MFETMKTKLYRMVCALVAAFFCVLSSFAAADRPAAVLEKLKQPGVHAIMRHAIAPGFGDPESFRLNDCATQRNLDNKGRNQARKIGETLREAGITFDEILTSEWCRCRETAKLLKMGKPRAFPVLNSFFQDRSTADEQTRALKMFVRSLNNNEKVLFVTHQVNITALTRRGVASGEIFLIRIGNTGTVEVVGKFLVR